MTENEKIAANLNNLVDAYQKATGFEEIKSREIVPERVIATAYFMDKASREIQVTFCPPTRNFTFWYVGSNGGSYRLSNEMLLEMSKYYKEVK